MTDVTQHLTADLEPALEAPTALLYFSAPWCGPCRTFKPILEQFAVEHPEITLVKIDVDETRELAGIYNVKGIPTLVVLHEGAEVARKVGGVTKTQLEQLIAGA